MSTAVEFESSCDDLVTPSMNVQTNESQTVLSNVIKRVIESQSESVFKPVKQSETLHLQNAYLIGEEEYITSTPLLTKMI